MPHEREKVEKKRTLRFIHQIRYVRLVRHLQRAYIFVFRAPEHLGERRQVHAQRHGAVAAVAREPGRGELDGDERDVRVVHSLQLDFFFVALQVGVGDELFDDCT
ncbi:hypothetical protein CVT25_004667 [Psilocybe cyanescens]|uniref:Uncharacterized protein n=1 Tax=Psilocybe cyanescens TaxID=93625 RepID=A0A409WAY4_PSICY|nr:hypothetical protein CVT25_004667 [Psilocybe cyanescens]